MEVTFGGKFESALLRELTVEYDPQRLRSGTPPYYNSLLRPVAKDYFTRAATILAISNKVSLPLMDWPVSQPAREALKEYCIDPFETSGASWYSDLYDFSGLVLEAKAFSSTALATLAFDTSNQRLTKKTADYARDNLLRLLVQIRSARLSRSMLVLGVEDKSILEELNQFVLRTRIPTPIDLPALDGLTQAINGDDPGFSLLDFGPPDARSLLAVRRDPVVEKYARVVRPLLTEANSSESPVGLIHAMRDAHKATKTTAKRQKVFEAISRVCKPLGYVPDLGGIVAALTGGVADIAKRWFERKKEDQSWHLLGVRAKQIAVEDYLQRTGNQ